MGIKRDSVDAIAFYFMLYQNPPAGLTVVCCQLVVRNHPPKVLSSYRACQQYHELAISLDLLWCDIMIRRHGTTWTDSEVDHALVVPTMGTAA